MSKRRAGWAPGPCPADVECHALAERDGHWFPVQSTGGTLHLDGRYPFCLACGIAFAWRWTRACRPPFGVIVGRKGV